MSKDKELATLVLTWWKEHEDDVTSTEGAEYNLYDDEPLFVTKAKELLNA